MSASLYTGDRYDLIKSLGGNPAVSLQVKYLGNSTAFIPTMGSIILQTKVSFNDNDLQLEQTYSKEIHTAVSKSELVSLMKEFRSECLINQFKSTRDAG